ncbi:RNase J family beta-CASP ribonuclease [Candidatus Woesearchaeota archaeon]|nr:MAG: RNase J family beta-CASP ribonuclease [Candidatus Woesearchaeota archaeon]
MVLEICAVGGYSEVGKNMTAVRYNNEVIILDMGLFLPKIISYEEEEGSREGLTKDDMIEIGAVPDISVIESWRMHVKAIVTTHCHLDHIGAMPYLASYYDAPIIGTPYTIEVLRRILKDEKIKLKNPLKVMTANSKIKLSENFTLEFINATHSTLQVVMIALHTPEGVVLYCNDYKFDNHPTLGKKPNYDRLKKLGVTGSVKVLIADALYSSKAMKTPSERVAREMLKDVLLGVKNENSAIIVTTFASHIARLQSILDMGTKLGRKVVFLGRSLEKYISAAEALNLISFSKKSEVIGYANRVKRKLKEINKNKKKYLVVCTGNQAEPGSILRKMADSTMPFKFEEGDHVIFSCKTIPAPINMANRAMLEEKLVRKGCRLFKDIHVSGHGAKEDHRDLIELVRPKHIIPSHGSLEQTTPMSELASSMGYVLGQNIHLLRDGQLLELD